MKCGTWVQYKAKTRKTKDGPKTTYSPVRYAGWNHVEQGFVIPDEKKRPAGVQEDGCWTLCDGDVRVEDIVEYDGDYDSCNCHVNLTYKCTKCGMTHFPELPHDEDYLKKMVQAALDSMTDESVDGLREKVRQADRAAAALRAEMQAKMEARKAAKAARSGKPPGA